MVVTRPQVDEPDLHAVPVDAVHHEIDDLFKLEASARELPADTPQAPLSRLIDAAKARYPQRFIQVLN